MGDLTCPACRERKDVGHTHTKGCIVLSKEQLEQREREHEHYLEMCEREGQHPYYDTLEEKRGEK
jgi:hypothetical protein